MPQSTLLRTLWHTDTPGPPPPAPAPGPPRRPGTGPAPANGRQLRQEVSHSCGLGGTSSAGLRSKNPNGLSQNETMSDGITGQSSGRVR